jgi:plastocyanin
MPKTKTKTRYSVLHAAAIVFALAGVASADGSISGTVEAKPSKFLPDTIVYVKEVSSTKLTPKTFAVDQQGMEFKPHLVLVAVGDTVKFQNHDKVDHNVMSRDGHYDLGVWGSGQAKEHVFPTAGVFGQVCKLHPEMLAYVFVGQNRFASTVDAKGAFQLTGLPPGTYELDVWNPKLKAAAQKITVAAGAAGSSTTTTVHFSLTR